MKMSEEDHSLLLEGFLGDKSDHFGLSQHYISEMPLYAKQLLNRLDKLGSVKIDGKNISMLDESIMSSAWVEQNPELVQQATECDDLELPRVQRDLIRGSLLSDLGKVSCSEFIWLYDGLSFDNKLVTSKLGDFLESRGRDRNTKLLQVPYSLAMDFYREITYNGSEANASAWDQNRRDCDTKLKQLGFRVNVQNDQGEVSDDYPRESSLHEVLTGAHLAMLPEILEKAGIADDPDWESSIFIAKNHHLSRGLVNGLPLKPGQNYLETILEGKSEGHELKLRSALLEENLDMTFAAIFRMQRSGDLNGTDSRRRILENLEGSLEGRRMSRIEHAYIDLLVRRTEMNGSLSEAVVEFVNGLRTKE